MKIEFPLKICRQIYESWWSTINISSMQRSFPGVLGTGKFWSQRNRKGTFLCFLFKREASLSWGGWYSEVADWIGWECPPLPRSSSSQWPDSPVPDMTEGLKYIQFATFLLLTPITTKHLL